MLNHEKNMKHEPVSHGQLMLNIVALCMIAVLFVLVLDLSTTVRAQSARINVLQAAASQL